MNGAHLHLGLNHLPVLGTAFGAGLTAAGLKLKSRELIRAGLWTLVLAGLASVPAYLSGEEAEEVIEHMPAVLESAIHAHEEAAEKAFAAALAMTAGALGILYRTRRAADHLERLAGLALAGAAVVFGLMVWTAALGGPIRHPELSMPVVEPGPGED